MDELLAEGLGGQGSNGVWDAPHVARRRDALLSKGAAQGWLISDRDLRLGRIIGAGTFGQTYEADWHGVKVQRRALPSVLPCVPRPLRCPFEFCASVGTAHPSKACRTRQSQHHISKVRGQCG